MSKVYCISAGEYSDWCIEYSFLSEKKRDAFFEVVKHHEDDYEKYDLTLHDDKINIKDNEMDYWVFIAPSYTRYHSKLRSEFDHWDNLVLFVSEDLSDITYRHNLSKEEYLLYKDHEPDEIRKIYYDVVAKVKYMHEVDGMSTDDIIELYNSK